METNIIRIGNGNGLVIPPGILHAVGLNAESAVSIYVDQDAIVIRPYARQGWAAAAKTAHERGDDNLLAADVFEDDICT